MSIIPGRGFEVPRKSQRDAKPDGTEVAFDSVSRTSVGPPVVSPVVSPLGTRCSHGYRPPEPSDRGAPERQVGRDGRKRDDFYGASKCSALKHSVGIRSVL